jgi:hypothetical protein
MLLIGSQQTSGFCALTHMTQRRRNGKCSVEQGKGQAQIDRAGRLIEKSCSSTLFDTNAQQASRS